MANKIKINEKEVIINNKDFWYYDEIVNTKLAAINPKLADEIQKKVEYYLDNKEKIEAEKAEKQLTIAYNNNMILFNKFKTEIKTNHSQLIKDYKVTFYEPGKNSISYNSQEIQIDDIANIKYVNEIFDNWNSHTTDRPWVLTINYKDIRYSTLDKAIKAALLKVDALKIQQQNKKEVENKTIYALNQMKIFAKTHGFVFDTSYRSSKHYNHFNYTDSFSLKATNLNASIKFNYEKDEVKIISYKVTKPISIEDLKKVAKEVQDNN